MQNEKKWFTVSEAAKFLGVSPDTLRRWEKAGKISAPSRTAGGARRYSKELLEEILGGGGKKGEAEKAKKKTQSLTGKPQLTSVIVAIITLIITLAVLLPIILFLLK